MYHVINTLRISVQFYTFSNTKEMESKQKFVFAIKYCNNFDSFAFSAILHS